MLQESQRHHNRQSRIVAQGSQDINTLFGAQRPKWTGFGVAVRSNNSNVVYMCWHDVNGATPRLHVRHSMNRGVDWSSDLITVDNVILGDIAVNGFGTAGLLYQQLVSSRWETHLRTISGAASWDDLMLARTVLPSNGNSNVLGDYFRLLNIGPRFYGIFPAINTPGPGNFLPYGESQVR